MMKKMFPNNKVQPVVSTPAQPMVEYSGNPHTAPVTNRYLSMLRFDCTASNLSKVVLDMMSTCTSRNLNFMSGIGPANNTTHHDDGSDEQLGEDLMTLTAACAKVASEFSTASEYYDSIRSSVPTFMENFWIPERIALTLFHSTFGSGCVLFRRAGAGLREHVYGELSVMNQETRIPPYLKSWTKSMCRVTTQKPALPQARLGFNESFYAIPEIDAKTDGLLKHVLVPGKTVIAGGSVRDILSMRGKPLNDVDIWICGCRTQKEYEAEASRVANQLICNVKELFPNRCITSRLTPGVVTLIVCSVMADDNYYVKNKNKITIGGVSYKIIHRFQIVKRGFVHPMQIVLTFDMDDAKALYDGKNVYVTRTAIAALKTATSSDVDKYGPFGLEFAVLFDSAELYVKAFASEWQIQHPGHRMYSGSAQDFFDPVVK